MASTKVTIELTKKQADDFISHMLFRAQLGKFDQGNNPIDHVCMEIMIEISKDRGVKP